MCEVPLHFTSITFKAVSIPIFECAATPVQRGGCVDYRGTSLTWKRPPLEPYRMSMPRVRGGSEGGGRFLMGEVPSRTQKEVDTASLTHTWDDPRVPDKPVVGFVFSHLRYRGTLLKRNTYPSTITIGPEA